MFRQWAGSIQAGADRLFRRHPLELTALLERGWNCAIDGSGKQEFPRKRCRIQGLPSILIEQLESGTENTTPHSGGDATPVLWDHLIYAFMIENTGIYEVFRRVLLAYLHGEELGLPLEEAGDWLRNTEALFYQNAPSFFIHSLTSTLRPNLCATRRATYYRMFGLELSFPEDPSPAYIRAKAANRNFSFTFEEFLREVWVGLNESQEEKDRQTNDRKIAVLATKLHGMLTERRRAGNLAREEYFFVSMLSWFHLTLEYDSPIVRSLKAEATTPGRRLKNIAERVGVQAHPLAADFFDIADAISRILLQVETGIYNEAGAAPALYTPVDGGGPEQDIRTIITHWSITHLHALKFDEVSAN